MASDVLQAEVAKEHLPAIVYKTRSRCQIAMYFYWSRIGEEVESLKNMFHFHTFWKTVMSKSISFSLSIFLEETIVTM